MADITADPDDLTLQRWAEQYTLLRNHAVASTFVCTKCGMVMTDRRKHDEFHGTIDRLERACKETIKAVNGFIDSYTGGKE